MNIQWHCIPFEQLGVHDLYEILAARQEVFIVEQNCPYLDCDGKDLYAHHLSGKIDGRLAAYARLLPPGISFPEASIGRVITLKHARRTGAGKTLMQQAIAELFTLYGKQPIRIGAQSYLQAFYEGFGFEDTGTHYLEDGIPHMEMLLRI